MLRTLWRSLRSAALGLYLLARSPPPSDQAKYDAAARLYDSFFHRLWLIFGGLTAERALWRDLGSLLRPRRRLLDAGSGSGRVSRRIRTLEPRVRLALLDLSPEMLRLTADVPGERVRGSVVDLPFPDAHFDLVVSDWVLPNVAERERAISELVRVLRPGGYLLYTDCTLPRSRLLRIASAIPRFIIGRSFGGRFRAEVATPPGCREVHRHRGRRQMAVEVSLVKSA